MLSGIGGDLSRSRRLMSLLDFIDCIDRGTSASVGLTMSANGPVTKMIRSDTGAADTTLSVVAV